MNDFTKDELKILFVVINELILESTQPPCVHELREKVKDMSLNYCEHDFNGPAYNLIESNVRRADIRLKLCEKCGKLINDNT